MDSFTLTIIIVFVFLTASLFVLMISKSYFHFDYLKNVYPDKFAKYLNYFDTFNFEFFNKYRVILLFPVFRKEADQIDSSSLNNLIRKIKLFCRLIYLNVFLIILYVLILIIFFGDFSPRWPPLARMSTSVQNEKAS